MRYRIDNNQKFVYTDVSKKISEETLDDLLKLDLSDFGMMINTSHPPDKATAIKISALIDKYPNNYLKLSTEDRLKSLESLDFLLHIPNLAHLQLGLMFRNYDLSVVSTLVNLKSFDYYAAHKAKVDISPLEKCKKLESFSIDCKLKNACTLENMTQLRVLRLGGGAIDLNLIKSYHALEILYLHPHAQNVEAISELESIRSLYLDRVKGLEDLEFISELNNLAYLYLESLKEVTALPSFKGNSDLAYIYLDKMHGIKNLDNLKNLPNLKQIDTEKLDMLAQDVGVFLQDMTHLYYVRMLLKNGSETMKLFDIIDRLGINKDRKPTDFVWMLNTLYRP